MRAMLIGGSAAPPALIAGFDRHGLNVVQAWGMTEMNPLGSFARLKRRHDGIDGAAALAARARQGHSQPLVQFRHVNEAGQIQPWDGRALGELQVRGPTVARAYFGVEAGDEAFTPDGWFRTGDIVTIDEAGSILITDRARDVIKSGGEWISSVALENALMAHPDVAEAAVFAAEDERWGERPLAAIVWAPGRPADPEALRAFLEPQFLRWWLPAEFVAVDEIPKTSVGKFDKAALRRRFGKRLAEGREAPRTAATQSPDAGAGGGC
jgi:fatty-acyl-CoA synthase